MTCTGLYCCGCWDDKVLKGIEVLQESWDMIEELVATLSASVCITLSFGDDPVAEYKSCLYIISNSGSSRNVAMEVLIQPRAVIMHIWTVGSLPKITHCLIAESQVARTFCISVWGLPSWEHTAGSNNAFPTTSLISLGCRWEFGVANTSSTPLKFSQKKLIEEKNKTYSTKIRIQEESAGKRDR